MSEQPQQPIEVRWPSDSMATVHPINQFAVIEGAGTAIGVPEGSIYLVLGHVAPPILTSQADLDALIADGGMLPVSAEGAFFMTRERAAELWRLLGERLGFTAPNQ